jgi:polyvinyl alcohol dehydrogenase (cytochrome)
LPLTTRPHNGVPAWGGFAIDPGLNLLYFTTGNNYTGEASSLSDAIVAVDSHTGEIRWARQATPGDVWTMAQQKGPDYDFGTSPQLFEATIGGQARRLVGAGQKSGTFFALDRETGQPVWQAAAGRGATGGGILADAAVSGSTLWTARNPQPAGATGAGVLLGDVYFVPSFDGRVRGFRAGDGQLAWTSGEHASIGSSVAADDRTLYFGTGVPKDVGGNAASAPGVFAYRLAE